jgi:hypothetical protein
MMSTYSNVGTGAAGAARGQALFQDTVRGGWGRGWRWGGGCGCGLQGGDEGEVL